MKDILITLAIVVGYFILFGAKKKKKATPPPKKKYAMENESPQRMNSETEEMFSTEEEEFLSQETSDSYANFYPKNAKYFTYETIADEEQDFNKKSESFFDTGVEEESQIIDNEQENNSIIDLSKDELVKGVIYSEILKRPYN